MQGRVPRRRRGREGGQGQARRGDLNLINDATPLRVCFNHQDTLQQVDRMFTVNLHMSSERAVSLRTVRAGAASLGPQADPCPQRALLSPGVWGQWAEEAGRRALWPGSFLSGVPRSPHQNKSPRRLTQKNRCPVLGGRKPGAGRWVLADSTGPSAAASQEGSTSSLLSGLSCSCSKGPQSLRPPNSPRTTLPRMPWSTSRA